jgi:hypothetical protein
MLALRLGFRLRRRLVLSSPPPERRLRCALLLDPWLVLGRAPLKISWTFGRVGNPVIQGFDAEDIEGREADGLGRLPSEVSIARSSDLQS